MSVRVSVLSASLVLLAACGPQAEAPTAPEVASQPAAPACAPSIEVSTENVALPPGGCVVSPSGTYALTMKANGDLELTHTQTQAIVWSSHSSGGLAGSRHLGIQTDGNLVIYDSASGSAVWASGTSGQSGPFVLRVEDAGVAQYIPQDRQPIWSVPQ